MRFRLRWSPRVCREIHEGLCAYAMQVQGTAVAGSWIVHGLQLAYLELGDSWFVEICEADAYSRRGHQSNPLIDVHPGSRLRRSRVRLADQNAG